MAKLLSDADLQRVMSEALTDVAESEPAPLMPFVEESGIPEGIVALASDYRFARFGPHSLVHIVRLGAKGGSALCSSKLRSIPVIDRTDIVFTSDMVCPRCRQRYATSSD